MSLEEAIEEGYTRSGLFICERRWPGCGRASRTVQISGLCSSGVGHQSIIKNIADHPQPSPTVGSGRKVMSGDCESAAFLHKLC